MNGEIKQEKERSVEKTKEAGTVRESNKERSERKSAGRQQQQQQTAVVGELANSKSISAPKSGVTNVTSTSEGKRDAMLGYVPVLASLIILSAVKGVLSHAYQTVNSFATSETLKVL